MKYENWIVWTPVDQVPCTAHCKDGGSKRAFVVSEARHVDAHQPPGGRARGPRRACAPTARGSGDARDGVMLTAHRPRGFGPAAVVSAREGNRASIVHVDGDKTSRTATGEVALVEGGEEMEPLGSGPAVAPSSVPMEDGASEQLGPLSVRCVTWNVGELHGDFYEMHMLIPLLLGDRREVDIVAIGLQEAEMTAGSFLAAGVSYDETDKGLRWSAAFTKALETHRFVKIASCQLMGLHLSVFTRRSLAAAVTPGSVKLGNVGTGIGGMGFNKGCIAVQLELSGATWLFLNCHLAAGDSKVAARNSDWQKITSRLQFEGGRKGMDSDYVLVMGDMNYRIEIPGMIEDELRLALEPLRSGEAFGYVPNSLLQADQLAVEKSKGNVFVGFEEEPITFCPTYKYDVNTDVFDTSAKARSPSWCDRVLWRTHEKIVPVRGSYSSYTALKGSDHRPVGLELLVACQTPLHPNIMDALNAERDALVPLHAAVAGVPGAEAIMPSSFFHIAPDGSHEPYSATDSTLIAKARASGQPFVKLSDVVLDTGEVLQFEVRFGGHAWSSRMPQGCKTGMLQVNITPTYQDASREVVEFPACWSGTAALSGLEDQQDMEWQMGISRHADAGVHWQAAEPTWMPLDRSLVMSVFGFYMTGGPLYSSIVRLSEEQEVDLAHSQVRRLGLHQYFHIGPDGARSYYSQVDNTLIRAAVQFGERSVALDEVTVTLPDGTTQVMQFEVRFGENATSPRMPTPPPSGIIQVNLATNNTRVVDKVVDGVEVLDMRQVKLPSLSEQRQRALPVVAALEPEPEPEFLAAGRQAISYEPLDGDTESVLAQMIRAQNAKQDTLKSRSRSGDEEHRLLHAAAAAAVAAEADDGGGGGGLHGVPPPLPPHPPPSVTPTDS